MNKNKELKDFVVENYIKYDEYNGRDILNEEALKDAILEKIQDMSKEELYKLADDHNIYINDEDLKEQGILPVVYNAVKTDIELDSYEYHGLVDVKDYIDMNKVWKNEDIVEHAVNDGVIDADDKEFMDILNSRNDLSRNDKEVLKVLFNAIDDRQAGKQKSLDEYLKEAQTKRNEEQSKGPKNPDKGLDR